jgi:hypothetical protein
MRFSVGREMIFTIGWDYGSITGPNDWMKIDHV